MHEEKTVCYILDPYCQSNLMSTSSILRDTVHICPVCPSIISSFNEITFLLPPLRRMTLKCAHASSLVRAPPHSPSTNAIMIPPLFKPLLVFSLFLSFPFAYSAPDSQFLLQFKTSLANISSLSTWNNDSPPCTANRANWIGVICFNDSVRALNLDSMGLSGKIDVQALTNLPYLRSISFVDNLFEGELPDFKMDRSLRAIYLSGNRFSGEIPDDAFAGMNKLRKVFLSGNRFTGPIPSSLANIPNLVALRLDSNNFTGTIPPFTQHLHTFNVSGNALEGPIPSALSKLDASSFSGI